MRLFIAFTLPDNTKNNLWMQSQMIRPFATKGRFVDKLNYHVTLQFLGEVDEDKLAWIYQAMDGLRDCVAPTLSIAQVTAWRSAKVVCAKYKAKDVDAVQQTLADRLERAGFAAERRAYKPHTTICRDYAFDLPFSEVVKNVPLYNKPFVCDTVTLYQTEFTKTGVQYHPLYEVKLRVDE